jgi:hypothetical protein
VLMRRSEPQEDHLKSAEESMHILAAYDLTGLRCPGSAAGSDLARRIESCQHHASTTRRPVTVR